MCGFVGYWAKGNQVPAPEVFDRSVDLMTHRGPDDRGIWKGGQVGLGFRRLSVIDLQTGHQPMSNEDGNLQVVFNGEIYNHQTLRNHLKGKGHHFKTRSDSEVILHLYEEEGNRCVEQLLGMFAFAIYDSTRSVLFLARDRFGKKPLFYAETPMGFFFGSEIPSVQHLAQLPRDTDREAIDAYLALGYAPTPRTAWRGIQRLAAGSTLEYVPGRSVRQEGYWRLSWASSLYDGISEQEAIQGVRERLEESVRGRLVSDVPLGAFLSGGVDSSVVVAAMARVGCRPKTFCIGFEDPRFDESLYAREVARRVGADHHELVVRPDSLEGVSPLLESLGEPFGDHSILPTYALSKWTRDHVTVALSGDGGDELFGGYKRYQHLSRVQALQHWHVEGVWKGLSQACFKLEQLLNPSRRTLKWPRSATEQILGLSPLEGYLRLRGGWSHAQRRKLWKTPPCHDPAEASLQEAGANHPGLSGISQWQALDIETYLVDDILRKLDVASMACSLECRCPLLDPQLAEFVAGLPETFKKAGKFQRHPSTKGLLRNLYPDLLPSEFFDREKKGFSLPMGSWLRGPWKETFRSAINGEWSQGFDLNFHKVAVRELWTEHQEGTQDHGQRLWNWWMLYQWDQKFHPHW